MDLVRKMTVSRQLVENVQSHLRKLRLCCRVFMHRGLPLRPYTQCVSKNVW